MSARPGSRRRRPRSPRSRSCTSPDATWSSTGTPPAPPSPTGPRRCPATRVTLRRTPRSALGATARRAIATPSTTCGRAVDRLTSLNPNPEVGEAHYLLGLTLSRLGRDDEAYAAFAKATWLDAWVAAGQSPARDHRRPPGPRPARRSSGSMPRCGLGPTSCQVRNLAVRAAPPARPERRGRTAYWPRRWPTDPLDIWARQLAGSLIDRSGHTEAQTLLDVALENARIGNWRAAVDLLDLARASGCRTAARSDRLRAARRLPRRAGARRRCGDHDGAAAARARRAAGRPDLELRLPARRRRRARGRATRRSGRRDGGRPARPLVLRPRPGRRRDSPLAPLGRARPESTRWSGATWPWPRSTTSTIRRRPRPRTNAHSRVAPGDAKLLFESDQLLKRIGAATDAPAATAGAASRARSMAPRRPGRGVRPPARSTPDRPADALAVLDGRRFQPWEGGEGQVLRAWERTQLALAAAALSRRGRAEAAVGHVRAALDSPDSLGEARHPLANPAAPAAGPRRRPRRRRRAEAAAARCGGRPPQRRRLLRHEPAGLLGEHLLLGARRPPAGR